MGSVLYVSGVSIISVGYICGVSIIYGVSIISGVSNICVWGQYYMRGISNNMDQPNNACYDCRFQPNGAGQVKLSMVYG